jgi:uncharacterized membrane protein YkoI
MFRMSLIPVAMATVIAVGATAGLASAGTNDNAREMAAFSSAKISLSQAIAAAEQKVGGKAMDGGLSNENGVMTFAVEVVDKANTVQTVLVDLNTGGVIKVAPADTESEGNAEQDGQESGN